MTETQMVALASLSDLAVLSLTICGEAENELIEGQVAVGAVIRNRVHAASRFGETYQEVCWAPKQFSCWNSTDPNFERIYRRGLVLAHGHPIRTFDDQPAWKQIRWVAQGILDGCAADNTKGACHYMTRALYAQAPPTWAVGHIPDVQRGRHVFFVGIA